MPFRGLLSGLLGNQSGDAQQATIVHDPQTDSVHQLQGQAQQMSNEQRQAFHQGINHGSQQQAQQNQTAAGLYQQMLYQSQMWSGTAYMSPAVTYDTSNATTLKMLEVMKKAYHGIKALEKLKESV
jgi:hypothetical protein